MQMGKSLLIILIALICAVSGCNQERTNPVDEGGVNFQPATIEGTVISTTGISLEGAEVTNKIDNDIIDSDTTNEEGKYQIPEVLPGKTHTVIAIKEGYSEGEKNVIPKPGEVSKVDFELSDKEKPTITHTPKSMADFRTDVIITTTVIDNEGVLQAKVFYKISTEDSFTESALEETSEDTYTGMIPSDVVVTEGVNYYIYVEDTTGNFATNGSNSNPHHITVTLGTPSLSPTLTPTPTPSLSPNANIALAVTETDVTGGKVDRGAVVSLEVIVTAVSPDDVGKVDILAEAAVLGTATKSIDDSTIKYTFDWETGAKDTAGAFIVGTGEQNISARVLDLVEKVIIFSNSLAITVETGAPKIVNAIYTDIIPGDGVGASDTITVTFSEDIILLGNNPSMAFDLIDPLGVITPSFGTSALMSATGATVAITLGTSPILNMAGAGGNVSRIDLAPTNTVITDLVGNPAEGLTPAVDGKDSVEITPADSTRPTVTTVVVTDANDEDLGLGDTAKLVITFSERMNTAVAPTIIFSGLSTATAGNFNTGVWSSSGGGLLDNVYTITSVIAPISNGLQPISISGASDIFGNIMLTDSSNTHNVDTTIPTILSATFADSGSVAGIPDAGDTITVVFSEDIKVATPDLTNFLVFVSGGTPVANPFGISPTMAVGAANEMVITLSTNPLIAVTGTYSAGTVGTPSGIAIATTANIGITDLAGNLPAAGTAASAKDISLATGVAVPTVATAKVVPGFTTVVVGSNTATTGTTAITVQLTFDQVMDPALNPNITIDLVNGAPAFIGGSWSGGIKIYTATSTTITFDSADTLANKQATILGARNGLGSQMTATSVSSTPVFAIDATRPQIMGAALSATTDRITITFNESITTIVTDASTLFTVTGGGAPNLAGLSVVSNIGSDIVIGDVTGSNSITPGDTKINVFPAVTTDSTLDKK